MKASSQTSDVSLSVGSIVEPWVRWLSENQMTHSFWHALSNEDETVCGFAVPHREQDVQVTEGEPKLDACTSCKRILRGDHPVFDKALKVSEESLRHYLEPELFNPEGEYKTLTPFDIANDWDG